MCKTISGSAITLASPSSNNLPSRTLPTTSPFTLQALHSRLGSAFSRAYPPKLGLRPRTLICGSPNTISFTSPSHTLGLTTLIHNFLRVEQKNHTNKNSVLVENQRMSLLVVNEYTYKF